MLQSAVEKSQKFYSDSFANLLCAVSIFTTIFVVIFSLFGFVYYLINKSNVKKMKKEFENNMKEQIKKQNEEFNSKLEEQKEGLKATKNNIIREIARSQLSSINIHILRGEKNNKGEKDKTFFDFFYKVGLFHFILVKGEIELNKEDVKLLSYTNIAIDKYINSIEISGVIGLFSYSLLELIDYCEKTNKKEHLEIVNETWKKLCDLLGGEDKAKKTAEDYKMKPIPSYPD
jgi:hypothetical protein